MVIYFGYKISTAFTAMEQKAEMISSLAIMLLVEPTLWSAILYFTSKCLTFDLSTGEMTYHSLFCRKRKFHVSEIETEIDFESCWHRSAMYSEGQETLHISSDSVYITISLGQPHRRVHDRYRDRSLGGEENAALLLRFLDANGKLDNMQRP